MPEASNPILHHLRTLVVPGEARRLTDGQLLERFVQGRDEAAFEVLVHRHGAMVWRVCRQVLRDTQDAEDACQATFLVLVRKARGIARPELLGNWLYGVAVRVAHRVRKTASRRQAHERPGVETLGQHPADPGAGSDPEGQLHEELQRLPAKYRCPLVLCYLEGRTNEEAARQLRWPVGTLKVRLMRGREMLRLRLVRRGLGVSAGVLGSTLARGVEAALPAPLAETILKAALPFAAGAATRAGASSTPAVALAEGVLRSMMWTTGKIAAAVVVAVGLLGTGAGWLTFGRAGAGPATPNVAAAGVPPGAAPHDNRTAEPARPAPPLGRPLPLPGGDGVIIRERFTRTHLSAINTDHDWFFQDRKFILTSDTRAIPPELQKALLGPDRQSARIVGEWDLDTGKGDLVLTAITADGKPGRKEVRLHVSPAGLRVNLEHGGQYNVISFPPRLVVEKGVTYPIHEHATRIDREFLQGTWQVVGREVEGRKVPPNDLQGARIVVQGSTLTLTGPGAVSRGTFTLDVASTPRALDVTFTEGPEKGTTWRGIYQIQGDTWTFCRSPAGKDRPTAFLSKPASGQVLETLQRRGEDPTALKVGGELPFLVADFTTGRAKGHCGCPSVMIRNDRARALVVWSRTADPAVLRLAKKADEDLVCGKRVHGYLILFDPTADDRARLDKADLEGVSAGPARQSADKVFKQFGIDTRAAQVVFLVDNREVKAMWVLAPGELTSGRIGKILEEADKLFQHPGGRGDG
jgi:RNA polymerase sigma factor (sigma-70 family)